MKTNTLGIIVLILVVISLSTFGTTHAYFYSRQVSGSYLVSTWQSSFWTQTTQADFLAGVPVNVDITSSPGNVKLVQRSISPTIYATQGGETATVLKYNISDNTWKSLSDTPGGISKGGALVYVNQTNLYALRGGGTTDFYQYSITDDKWSSLKSAPAAIDSGGALVYTGGNFLYAFRGNNKKNFYQYSIPDDKWSSLKSAPAAIDSGGALVYTGGNFLYAFRGGGETDFYQYSIPDNKWSSLKSTAEAIDSGGALASDNKNYIYAFNGATQKFWIYNISANIWNDTVVSDPPGSIGGGGSLTYMPPFAQYQSTGTLATQVYNSGQAGTHWDVFEWDEITHSGITDISFEVRTSDTGFTKTDPLPSWISIGVTSPVRSGLPPGRYLQWRATLSTSDTSKTPILNEVRPWYS